MRSLPSTLIWQRSWRGASTLLTTSTWGTAPGSTGGTSSGTTTLRSKSTTMGRKVGIEIHWLPLVVVVVVICRLWNPPFSVSQGRATSLAGITAGAQARASVRSVSEEIKTYKRMRARCWPQSNRLSLSPNSQWPRWCALRSATVAVSGRAPGTAATSSVRQDAKAPWTPTASWVVK